MNINGNFVKGLVLVIGAGAIGGLISNRMAAKKYEQNLNEHNKKLEELRYEAFQKIKEIRRDTSAEMEAEARKTIDNDLSLMGTEMIHNEVLKRVQTVDIDRVANEAAVKGVNTKIERLVDEIAKDARNTLKEEIASLAKETVEERLKEEMYQVNSRRIIEDSVDRAVREEVGKTVREKLKWLSASDLKAFMF